MTRKLKKLAESEIARVGESQSDDAAVAAIQAIASMTATNRLLAAAPELRDIKLFCKSQPNISLRASEEKGTIRVQVDATAGSPYHGVLILTLGPHYPAPDSCTCKLIKSNIPKPIVQQYITQAQEIIRRCGYGFTPEQALASSNPIKPPKAAKATDSDYVDLSSGGLRDLKQDVRFLKKTKELRAIDQTRQVGNAKQFANASAERKQARRTLRKLATSAAASESERIAAKDAEKQSEALAAGGIGSAVAMASAAAGAAASPALSLTGQEPTPCAGLIFNFLARDFLCVVSQLRCAISGKRILPADPARAARYCAAPKHARHPVRVMCGHWYLLRPLQHVVTAPPFIVPCPRCGQRLYTPRFAWDVKVLAERHSSKMARQREVEEVGDFLELGAEFTTTDDTMVLPTEDGLDDSDWDSEDDASEQAAARLYTPLDEAATAEATAAAMEA